MYAIVVLLARYAKHVHVPGCLTIAQPQDRARSGPMFLFSALFDSFGSSCRICKNDIESGRSAL